MSGLGELIIGDKLAELLRQVASDPGPLLERLLAECDLSTLLVKVNCAPPPH